MRANPSDVLLSLVLAFAAPVAASAAEPAVLDLKAVSESLPVVNVFDLDPAKPLPRKGGLLELKWHEVRKEWKICRDQAARLQPSAKDLEGWVARTRLDCALRADADGAQSAGVAAAFDAVPMVLMQAGPWDDSLRDLWVRAGLRLAGNAKAKPADARRRLQAILDRSDVLTKEQRASALAQYGALAAARKEYDEALFFLRQAEDLVSTSSVQGQIASLEDKRAGAKKDKSADTAPETAAGGAEADAEADVQKALAQGRREEAVRLMVEILNRFPTGRSAAKYKSQVQDLLLASADLPAAEASNIRSAAKEADASRLADWAGVMHRRGDDRGSLDLAERALESLNQSPQAANLLYIAGRSSSFLGDPERANRFFDRLVQYHVTSEQAGEGLFRLALQHVRSGNYVTAAKLFDKLLAQNRSKWDLNARYWRVRALEKTDAERARAEREDLISRYPFTYYGLRLKAERDNGFLEFSKTDRSPLEAMPAKTWLVGTQKKTWDRLRRLSAEGWLLEAQAELAELPAPSAPWSLILWAKTVAKAGQYPAAILFVNRATEKDETLRHPRYVESVFPRAYSRWIEPQAKSYGLDPVLVRSLVRQESAFGLRATSTSSAMGLMQLIPPTAREVADELKMNVAIPEDMYRPEVNVPMGTFYIAKMLREFGGSVPLALAGYNAGPHRINQWLRQRPDLEALRGKETASWQDEIWYDELPWAETSFYVKAILRNVLIDRLIDQGRVAVTPAFWSDLRTVAAKPADEGVKRR